MSSNNSENLRECETTQVEIPTQLDFPIDDLLVFTNDITTILSDIEEENAAKQIDFFKKATALYAEIKPTGEFFDIWELFFGIFHKDIRDENKNVCFLRWVLDCNASHGQGNLFLLNIIDVILKFYLNESFTNPELSHENHIKALENILNNKLLEHSGNPYVITQNEYSVSSVRFCNKHNLIDLVIENNNVFLAIEAKTKVDETSHDQLERYNERVINKRNAGKTAALLFLSSSTTTDKKDALSISWKLVGEGILQALYDNSLCLPHNSLCWHLLYSFTKHTERL